MVRRLNLRATNRLRRNADFVEIRKDGTTYRCPYFALASRIRATEEDNADAFLCPRIGISVGRRVGNSVCRNKVKRRLRELFRLHQRQIAPNCDIAISVRPPARDASYAELEQRFLHALKYNRLLTTPDNQL